MLPFNIKIHFKKGHIMSKIAVVCWSGTGNTQTMAEAVPAGAKFACNGVICNEAPDDEALDNCKALGKALM